MYDGLRVAGSVLDLIGRTPLMRLRRIEGLFSLGSEIYAKLELYNPGGSVKDRIGYYMIKAARREGLIREGAVIVEPTSGNTGIGLAIVACVEGYLAVFTMPTKMSGEKERILRALGSFVIRTPTAVPPESPLSYYRVAEAVRNLVWMRGRRVSREELEEIVLYVQGLVDKGRVEELGRLAGLPVEPTPYAIIPNQYYNEYNPIAHYETTAREILEQAGRIDYLFAGMGTGGTITGIARFFRERGLPVKVIGVDPEGSIYSLVKRGVPLEEAKGMARPYKVEGIGEDFMPETIDLDLVDEVVVVEDSKAFAMARLFARVEGLLIGGSSGAALYAAVKYLKERGAEGSRAVVVFPDTGRNYLSKFYSDEWMVENGFSLDDLSVLGDVV